MRCGSILPIATRGRGRPSAIRSSISRPSLRRCWLTTICRFSFAAALGLRGDAAATQRAAKEFKIYYEKRKSGDSYSVDHSGQSYVLDPQGRLRLLVRPDRIAEDLPADLRTLLSAAR